jgi:hypothetical protein
MYAKFCSFDHVPEVCLMECLNKMIMELDLVVMVSSKAWKQCVERFTLIRNNGG